MNHALYSAALYYIIRCVLLNFNILLKYFLTDSSDTTEARLYYNVAELGTEIIILIPDVSESVESAGVHSVSDTVIDTLGRRRDTKERPALSEL